MLRTRDAIRRKILWTALVVVAAGFVLFPVIWMLGMMVKPTEIMFARPTQWLFFPTLEHFDYVIEQNFHHYLLTSVLLGLISTLLVVIIGIRVVSGALAQIDA